MTHVKHVQAEEDHLIKNEVSNEFSLQLVKLLSIYSLLLFRGKCPRIEQEIQEILQMIVEYKILIEVLINIT